MPRVLVFGTFDLLHPGHRFVLTEAQKRGDLHVVVARDATVARMKNLTPHHSEAERAAMIKAAFPEAQVRLGSGDGDFLAPVRDVQPDLIVLGYDQGLPPGVTETDFPCQVERLPAFEPDKWKSSLLRLKPR